jgi:hypothetical protein
MNAKPVRVTTPEISVVRPTMLDVVNELTAIQLRNIEALTRAQQTMMDDNRTIIEQYLDTFKSTAAQSVKATQEIMSEADLKVNLGKCFAGVKASMQDSIGNVNIISEMSARSGAQVAEIGHERTFKALDELQTMLEKLLASYWAAPLTWRR